MTLRRALYTAALAIAGLGTLACGKKEKSRIALVGATVIDGWGEVIPNAVIVISRARIDTVAGAGYKVPDDAVEVDLAGRFIIPGLIDAQAHVARWAIPRYLAAGVTTIRDLHGMQDSVVALADEVNLGSIAGPRVFIAGAAIDGNPPSRPDMTGVVTPDAARRAVDQRSLALTHWVSVSTRITPTLLHAVTDEASRLAMPVAAELGVTDAVAAATEGVRSLELLSGIPQAAARNPAAYYAAWDRSYFDGWNYAEKGWAGLDSVDLHRVAVALAGGSVFLVPVLVAHETWSRLDDPAILTGRELAAVPDSIKSVWDVPGFMQRAGWTQADLALFRLSRPKQDLFIREFVAAGGRIVAGSDAGEPMLIPGQSLHRELELLVAAGLTPKDALATATRNAAQMLAADSLGRIAPGKVADLVVLTANPLTNIRNLRSVETVIVRGQMMPADSIRADW